MFNHLDVTMEGVKLVNLQVLQDRISDKVKERGGLALRGWIDPKGERDRQEPLVVHVMDDQPGVWVALAEHSKPPAVWVSTDELILDDDQ